ncbi:MAG: SDR family oxidoreductase [Spongiibacteraceae bacterium]
MSARPVILLQRAGTYVGPALARRMARAGYDLALHAPKPGQVDELAALGAKVASIDVPLSGAGSDATVEGWRVMMEQTRAAFDRLDSVALFPPAIGVGVAIGPFLQATPQQMHDMSSYQETTLIALQAVIPPLQREGGQVLVFTSDAGAKPAANWALYGAARAGQNFLVRAVAMEHAAERICINVLGSKNAIFPGFPGAPAEAITDSQVPSGAWSEALERETPLGRLGTMEELAAFAQVLLDGSNRFQTGQYFSYSGGWNT